MTEKEKMLLGESYDSRDKELLQLYHKALKFLKKYNALDSEMIQQRDEVLIELFQFKGPGVWIEAPFFCDYGENISVGANTFINTSCIFVDNNKISIGKNALIGPHVQIYTSQHPVKASERIIETEHGTSYRPFTKPVNIGDNVWIGGNSVILPSVTIGDNVTIGAGSVVTKNIPDNHLAFGNPCEIKRKL